MKRNISIVIGVIVLVAIAAAVLLRNRAPETTDHIKGPEKVSVRMKWFFAGTMTGWFAGKEQGIFRTNGIDLSITPGGPDNNSVKLVAAGSDLFGVAGADEVLLARAKGIPVVAIGVLFKDSPICFISKKSKSIRSPKDWSGKTIEVSYGSNAEVQYRALVAKFQPENMKEVPYTFNLLPFIEDKVDVSVAYRMDQVVTLERKGIDLSIMAAKDYGINPYGDVVITTEQTLKEKADLVRRFMTAVVQSQRWACDNPERAVNDLVAGATSLDKQNELAVWKATMPFLLGADGNAGFCQMQRQRWGDTREVLVKYGGLDPSLEVSSAFTNVLSK
jgi:ABC-type nitrate/sulfonate/bicarbonate transport system substrate-binding protein